MSQVYPGTGEKHFFSNVGVETYGAKIVRMNFSTPAAPISGENILAFVLLSLKEAKLIMNGLKEVIEASENGESKVRKCW